MFNFAPSISKKQSNPADASLVAVLPGVIIKHPIMEISIKKGRDLPLAGAVPTPQAVSAAVEPQEVGVSPDDFPGFVPKVDVKEGDHILAGQPVLHHKENEAVKIVSPVSGTVAAVERGERRRILCVKVKPDAAPSESVKFNVSTSDDASAITGVLAASGLLAMMRQRPFDIVPDMSRVPRDIFVSAFDSAPLAVTLPIGDGDKELLEAGVALLSRVTRGKVYISRRAGAIPDIAGAVMVDVRGPHPAGLAGVQIANIKPVNKGETVWTLSADTLRRVGQLATTGTVDWHTCVAVTGSEVATPYIVRTVCGAAVEPLMAGHLSEISHHVRVISGNVLTGVKIPRDGYLRYPYTQLTVIAEGDDVDEFMGWASVSPKKISMSPSYPGSWFRRLFAPDARLQGGRRAMIMSGLYDKYIPMDIMPEYLLKAIASNNIEQMEKLGIYEVAPEDFALAEFADSSKQPLQAMVRAGLEALRREVE